MPRVTDAALRRAFILAAAVWPLLLLISTYMAASGPHGNLVYVITVAVYAAAGVVCHQRAERSFHVWGAQLPVCARCAGIYAGAAAVAVAAAGARLRPIPTPAWSRRLLVAAVLPATTTLVYEWATGRMPSHWLRAASGAPIGAAVAWVIHDALARASRPME